MNVRFLTLHHNLTRSMVQPTHTNSLMNLSLVVGTSNNLYKALEIEDQAEQSQINVIILELWEEKIKFISEKLVPLEKQVKDVTLDLGSEPLYVRLEFTETNKIAESLVGLFERLDKALIALQQLSGGGIDNDKYDRFLLYFGDKVSELLHFPYQQSPELHQRILRSQL